MPSVSSLGRQAGGSREDVGDGRWCEGGPAEEPALRPGTPPLRDPRGVCRERVRGPPCPTAQGRGSRAAVLATFQMRIGLVRRSDGGINRPLCVGGVHAPRGAESPPGSSLTSLRVFSPQSCQADLVKDNGHKYFLSVLADPYMPVRTSPFCLGRGDTPLLTCPLC